MGTCHSTKKKDGLKPGLHVRGFRDFQPNKEHPEVKEEDTITSFQNIRNVYTFKKSVGHGHFGSVRIATLNSNPNLKFAIKSIEKEKIKKDIVYLKRELVLLRSLDHPNIIRFHETFQDEKYIYFVMEYCSGGELIDRITEKGHLTEHEIAVIMQKAFAALTHLHALGIAHRDIKPENFLFLTPDEDSELKLIDFGLSKSFGNQANVKLTSMVGTPLYVSPEVLNGSYDERCDNWSLGVIMYLMLVGYHPFDADHIDDIFEKIKVGKYSIEGKGWKIVSKEAKDLISKLLVVNPDLRIAASEAIKHPWFGMNLDQKKKKISSEVVDKLSRFRGKKKFQNEILKVIINHLTEEEIKELKENFRYFDKDNSGFITAEDMHTAMKELGKNMTIPEIEKIVEKVNVTHKDHTINYTEFIAATMDKKFYLTKEKLWDAFKYFDVENTGVVTTNDIREALAREGRNVSNDEIKSMIQEIDSANNGKLTFDEFCRVMKAGEELSPSPTRSKTFNKVKSD